MSLLATNAVWRTIRWQDRAVSRFGAKLRALRKRRRLTLQELAQHLGYASHTYLSEVERGWKDPSLAMVLAVADLFGVTTDQLLWDNITLDVEDEDATVH